MKNFEPHILYLPSTTTYGQKNFIAFLESTQIIRTSKYFDPQLNYITPGVLPYGRKNFYCILKYMHELELRNI